VLAGCAPETGPLVAMEAFELLPFSEDPIPDRPDDAVPCPRRATAIEAGALELDSTVCDWITVQAPALIKVREGQDLELFFFHAALAAPEPTEAVMEVRLGDEVIWRQVDPVPSSDAFYDQAIPSPVALSPGDPVIVHVHNHGANTYTLAHLRAP